MASIFQLKPTYCIYWINFRKCNRPLLDYNIHFLSLSLDFSLFRPPQNPSITWGSNLLFLLLILCRIYCRRAMAGVHFMWWIEPVTHTPFFLCHHHHLCIWKGILGRQGIRVAHQKWGCPALGCYPIKVDVVFFFSIFMDLSPHVHADKILVKESLNNQLFALTELQKDQLWLNTLSSRKTDKKQNLAALRSWIFKDVFSKW